MNRYYNIASSNLDIFGIINEYMYMYVYVTLK